MDEIHYKKRRQPKTIIVPRHCTLFVDLVEATNTKWDAVTLLGVYPLISSSNDC